jgi:hypothetical protein
MLFWLTDKIDFWDVLEMWSQIENLRWQEGNQLSYAYYLRNVKEDQHRLSK